MLSYFAQHILKEWKKEAKSTKPLQYKYKDGVLTIYTSQPGYLIGKAGHLYNKYRERLLKNFPKLKEIKMEEVYCAD